MQVKRSDVMHVAGAMSGTSADGIDVAVLRIQASGSRVHLTLLAHEESRFTPNLRQALLDAQDARAVAVDYLARLRTRLGVEYARCIQAAVTRHGVKIDLAGCHGQTIYHQPAPRSFLGAKFATTWQLLDPSPVVERLRVPVVSDFRPADVAAGGQGAPLVALFDFEYFRHAQQHRLLLNLGGIGNITLLPAGAGFDEVLAFDTGPANMLVDALMVRLFGRPFDREGRVAARGRAHAAIVAEFLRRPFFRAAPPKTAGREQFGERFAADFLRACRRLRLSDQDAVATATLLTAGSVRLAIDEFCRAALPQKKLSLIVSGGGSRNPTLMRMLAQETAPLDCAIKSCDALGMPSQAKEAAAFALLAWKTWHHLPGNVPSATGAARPVVLGRVSFAS